MTTLSSLTNFTSNIPNSALSGLIAVPLYTAVNTKTLKIRTKTHGLVNYENAKVELKPNESLSFGVVLGLTQLVTPKIMNDQELQRVLVNPLIATMVQYMIKEIFFNEKMMNRYIVKTLAVGVASSAISNAVTEAISPYKLSRK
jgi:hypothetical protein